jgi:hypothetical protein
MTDSSPLQVLQEIITALLNALPVLIVVILLALIGAVSLLVIAARQIRSIEIPEDADFFETLRLLPITVPLALDLLDLAFDVFAAPIAWVILELMGLKALQLITVFEGLLPGTQVIPTLTIGWIIAKSTKASTPTALEVTLRQRREARRRRYQVSSLAEPEQGSELEAWNEEG